MSHNFDKCEKNSKGDLDLKKNRTIKFFSTFLSFVMVLSLLMPISTSAAEQATKAFKASNVDESILQQKAAIAEQLSLLEGEARLHPKLQKVSGDKDVAVIVHLSEKSVALEKGIKNIAGRSLSAVDEKKVRAKVQAQQTKLKKEMKLKKISFKEGYSFDTVLNGFAATVKADDIRKLLEVEGVTLIEPDTEVHAFEDTKASKANASQEKSSLVKNDKIDTKMNTSISFLGIEQLWNEGFEGQGIKVAVLDTGIDSSHPEFAGNYKGGKNFIPHTGSDYARPRADNDGSETSPLDRPANKPEYNERGSSFYTSHGTHVAGTIAAMGNNPYGIKGIAPKVDLYSYRVLGAYGSGSNSGVIKGIDTAVIDQMDVINLSLGGGSNTETDASSFAINNAMLAGTIAAIATGNSGPNRGTIGTPATSRLGIAVGNSTNPETKNNGQAAITAGAYQYSKQLNLMATTFGADLATQLQGEFEIVAVPGAGKATDYNGLDVTGKVALISRGEIAFVDKIAIAKEQGAIATIIHNFAGGSNAPNESGVFLGDSFSFLPTFDMSVTDADAIRAALAAAPGTITFGNFGSTATLGDEVNSSSSRGPTTPNFDIKPDITAPGTNIMSSIPMYGADYPGAVYDQAYDRKTGTSMATPHIAGIAALVQQANPDWNAFDVKVALSNTAKLLDTTKYDVFTQGPGRVDAYAAAHPTILAYAIDTANNADVVVENLKGTVTFGPQSLERDLSVTKQIRVKDMKGLGGDYSVTVDVKKSFADAKLTVDKPTFNLAGEEVINVTLTASQNPNVKAGDELLGYIHITGNDSDVSLPFAADFGGAAADELKDLKITETDLSFNGDGVKDSAVLSFGITGDVSTNFIEIWDIMNPTGGEFKDGYIGYLHASNALPAGSYTLDITGNYYPWTEGVGETKIPDGLYTIDFTGQTISGNPPVLSGYVGPVIVKSQAGTIEGTVSGRQVTGKIVDKYIEYNKELLKYDLDFDLNEKLKASYEVLENDVVKSSGNLVLEQDGAFAFETSRLAENEVIKVKYADAAGNAAEQILQNDGTTIDYEVDQESLSLAVGETAQLTVTETITKPDGTTEQKDVSADAVFQTANAAIATVEGPIVTAVAPGSTAVEVTYKDFTFNVAVEVTEEQQDIVTYEVNKKELSLGVGQQEQLMVTETTQKADGSIIVKDITAQTKFKAVNNKVAKVKKGLVTAIKAGKTQIQVKIPGQDTILVYVDVKEQPQDIVTYEVNKTNLKLKVGKQKQLKVTETTVKPDGTIVKKDVTAKSKFKVIDNTIATVKKGLVTAKKEGKTQVRVVLPNGEVTLVYLTVKADAEENEQTYTVSEEEIAKFINDKKAKKIILTVPDSQKEIAVEFSNAVLKSILKSEKDVVLHSNGATFTLEEDIFDELQKKSSDATITLGKLQAPDNSNALSDEYSIAFARGLGDSKVDLTSLEEDIEITLPIDATKLNKKDKVKVLNTLTNKYENGKVKNNNVHFETEKAGSFIVVKK